MDIKKEREAFEDWCASESLVTSRLDGEYIHDDTWTSWEAWRARAKTTIAQDRQQQYRPVYEEGWKDALEWRDRQSRGEPVGEIHPDIVVYGLREGKTTFLHPVGYFGAGGVKVYTAPQPAEPVKGPSYCTHPKCLIASGCSGPCRYGNAAQPRPTDDELWDKTLRDRDHYHDMADKLAEAIAEHFSADVGEHSNMNCPWTEALDVIGNAAQPATSAEPVVTDAMHAHFEGIYNGLDLADRTEIIEGILRFATTVAAQPSVPDGWKLVPDYKPGMCVKYGGEEYKIFALGDRPGTFDLCHPTDNHRDRWLNVPPGELEPISTPPTAGQAQQDDRSDWCRIHGCSHKNAGSPVWETQKDADKVDAAFEAVRQQLCGLTRFNFYLGDGCVRREADKSGNWLDFAEVHALFDPVSVDAARAQHQGGE